MIGIRSALSIRARGQWPHLEAVYMTAPRSLAEIPRKLLPRGGRPYMTWRENGSNHFVGASHLAQAADLMQHARELLDGIGLLQQLKTVAAVFRQHVAVTAGQYDRQVGVPAADFLGEFEAGHARHHH